MTFKLGPRIKVVIFKMSQNCGVRDKMSSTARTVRLEFKVKIQSKAEELPAKISDA